MDWPGLVRRYVWDEERTPYLVRPERLTGPQARNELFVYAFLLATAAAVVTAAAVLGHGRGGLAGPMVSLYGVTLLLAAIALGVTGHPAAAWFCATAPVALWLAALLGDLRPGMVWGEQLAVAVGSALWLAYAARVIRIARRLHRAPDQDPRGRHAPAGRRPEAAGYRW